MINFIKELPSYLNRKIKSKKISYSLTSIDLIVDYIFQKKIKPHYLLIEFDFLKQQNLFRVIISLLGLLKKLKKLNFKIIYIDNLNFTFKREI